MGRHRSAHLKPAGTPPEWTAFGKFLRDKKIPYAAAASAVGCTRQYACLLAKQQRSITVELAVRIAKWARSLGGEVPVASWPNLRDLADLAKVGEG